MSNIKIPGKFEVGDVVRHRQDFLELIEWDTNVPAKGFVQQVSSTGGIFVNWDDGTSFGIRAADIEHHPSFPMSRMRNTNK